MWISGLVRISQYDRVFIGPDRAERRVRVRQVLRAGFDGARRGWLGAELWLPAPLVRNELIAVEYDVVNAETEVSRFPPGASDTFGSVNQTVDFGNVIIDSLTLTTACSQGGDSGGAWLSNDKAVGLHSGGVSSCSPGQTGDNSVFQPVDEALTKWGLTVVTGGGTDTEPPDAPDNPRSTATTATSVSLAWDASSDNVGVAGYDVYNGQNLATSVPAARSPRPWPAPRPAR